MPPGSGFDHHCTQTGLPLSLRRSSSDDAAGVRAAADRRERLLDAALGVGRVGDERHPHQAGHLFRLDPQNAQGGTVGADKPRLEVFLDVGDRGFFIQVPQTLLACAKLPLQVKACQLRSGVRREDAKNEQLARLLRHRTVVEDGEMAENLAFRIAQRHSQVTFDSPLDQESVFGKVLPYPRGMVAQFAVDHVFTGRARERPLEILGDAVSGPEGDGAGPGTGSRARRTRRRRRSAHPTACAR